MDDVQHLEGLRQTYLQRLHALERQLAAFGLQAPPHVSIEIEDVRAKLADIDTRITSIKQLPSNSEFAISVNQERAEKLFSEATRYHLTGDLGLALQLFRQIQQIDPEYPRISALIREVEQELSQSYVGRDGRVRQTMLIKQHAGRDSVQIGQARDVLINNRQKHPVIFFSLIIFYLAALTLFWALLFKFIIGPIILERIFNIHIGVPWVVVGGILGFIGFIGWLVKTLKDH